MKEYRSLTIIGSTDQLVASVAEIEKALNDGWTRNRKIEDEGRQRGACLAPDDMRFCFTCTQTTDRKAALLVLMSNADGNLRLSNIVPDEFTQLTRDEFNYILQEFLHKFARPAAAMTGATIEASSGVVTIDDWFSKETADKLRRFLAISAGSTSDPCDAKYWKAFLISAHEEGAQVHEDLLRRWLIEDAGCVEYRADKLASEFQFSQEILGYKEEFAGA